MTCPTMQVSVSRQLPEEVPVVRLVLQVGDAEKVPQALGFESLDLFFFFSESASRVHVTQP